MAISKDEIKELIKQLDFKPVEGSHELYFKQYSNQNNFTIKINFGKEKIEYGNLIQKGDETTSHFENSENFVVLECINRLLEKGYKPENLSLEHKWPMGRKEKGKLDILVYDSEKKSFLMIECKTWGDEYEKEKKKMLRDGGQLFSYFQQDKAAQYLCLYASKLNTDIEFKNDIIKVDSQWKELNNQKEIYEHWNKNFKDNGIFESWANPYDIEIKALTRSRLKEMTEEDSGKIFNQFAEILRHNIVSDKPNAFNKIFNLFLCKIVDEDRNEDEELSFQWFDEDSDDNLQLRLNDLYKFGMEKYLHKKVTDFTDQEIDDKLYGVSTEEKQGIKDLFHKLRLRKNNEFSFKEVFDEKSFYENAVVVREVVELLQPYQIRYSHKQQFLGDFFELLLNTGLKQEAGQFFTPVPIAKFIISSIPIKELIQKKIKNSEDDYLPYIIDFAAGSGHFLTEAMDEIQNIIENFDVKKQKESIKKKFSSWKTNSFDWADDYIYGIEADYRLVKTAKVSCFLNGDGMANVIHADGLDGFKSSLDYQGLLKEISADDSKDNSQFDILVANPPYSVSAFKNTLKKGKESFELFDRLTDNSSEIECLFIERAKQLLKPSGWAGIILPSSILSNSGIYNDTREIILKYFNLIAIAEFGSNTFMATGTNTITMFLERRKNSEWKNIKQRIDSFFQNPKEATVSGIENAFSIYSGFVFDNTELTDYISFVNKNPNETIQLEELYKDYRSWFNSLTEIKDLKNKKAFKAKTLEEQMKELEKRFYEKVFENEKDKMLYFFLTYTQKTVIVKVGSGQAEKDFLGYEFSNRRGHEGIKMYRDSEGKLSTKLYNEDISLSSDKSNFYIYNAFLKNQINIDSKFSENISVQILIDLLDFKKVQFEKSINISVKKTINFLDLWGTNNLTKLGLVAEIKKGTSITKEKTINGTIPVIAGGHEPAYFHNESNRLANTITISASGAFAGFVNFFETPIFASDCNTIISNEEKKISTKLIYLFLKSIQNEIYGLQRGQAQPHVYGEDLANMKIPLPPLEIQQKIVSEIEVLEAKEKKTKEVVENLKENIKNVISKVSGELTSLSNITSKIGSGATPLGGEGAYKQNGISLIRSQNVYDNEFYEKGLAFIDKVQAEKLKGVTVEKNDILFNITGASICRCCIVPEKYLPARVNQHVSIIRVTEKVLPKYVQTILVSEIYKNQLLEIGDGATSREAITKLQLEDFKIPLPQLSEQKKIVSEIEKIEEKIKFLETEIADIPKQKEEILKKYLE